MHMEFPADVKPQRGHQLVLPLSCISTGGNASIISLKDIVPG